MRNRRYGQYAIAAAIAPVGALWLGVPIATIAAFALVLACPIMMLLMMSGMHGGDHDARAHHEYGSIRRPGSRDDPSSH
ncbi:MAG TPA: DUF2933 domain-containing protein [Actinomycetes bacterium]|nr:DUF2933 domain-containing protein [Actinomycetes bacterium]